MKLRPCGPSDRGIYKLVARKNWLADSRTLEFIHAHFSNYWWPLDAANDRDHIKW